MNKITEERILREAAAIRSTDIISKTMPLILAAVRVLCESELRRRKEEGKQL